VTGTLLERQLEASVNEKAVSLHDTRGAIVRLPDQHSTLQFTEQQEEMIRSNYSTGATKSEFEVLMAVAKARKLNPLLKQCFFIKRKDKKLNKDVWSVQVSIDGLRAIAERTGAYDGQDEPEFEHDKDGYITVARVRVYKKGVSRPFVGTARWSEYVQQYNGEPTKFWADMPYTMLGKCAEALAIRKAFPEDSGGLYVAEEMMQAEAPTPPERQLGAINPHDQEGDSADGDPETYEKLRGELASVDISLEVCDSYQKVLTLRATVGYKGSATPTDWQNRYRAAYDSLNGEQRKEIGRLWQRCDRQLAKLEEKLKPSAEASFTDPPDDDPEDFDRSA